MVQLRRYLVRSFRWTGQYKFSLVVGLLLLLVSGCEKSRPQEELHIKQVRFTPLGIVISLDRAAEWKGVTVLNQSGDAILSNNPPPGLRDEWQVLFPWQPATAYQLKVTLRNDNILTATIQSPSKDESQVKFSLQAPYGSDKGVTRAAGILATGSRFVATVNLESYVNTVIQPHVEISIPKDVRLINIPSGWAVGESDWFWLLEIRPKLTTEFDTWNSLLELEAPHKEHQNPLTITGKVYLDGSKFEITRKVELKILEPAAIGQLLTVNRVEFPTNFEGIFDGRRQPDSLLLPDDTAQFLRRLFQTGGQYRDYDAPYTYQTIYLKNTGDSSLLLLVTSEVLGKDGLPVETFKAPEHLSGGTGKSLATVMVGPGQTEAVILPQYVGRGRILPGLYRRHISVRLLGTDSDLATLDRPLVIRTRNTAAAMVTGISALISVVVFSALVFYHRRIYRNFKTSWFVLIALFGSTSFVTVNVPGTLLAEVLQALLGPFSFFITGLFYEVIFYALLTAVVRLIPKPGTAALVIFLRLFLQGIVFGQFTPLLFLWKGTLIVLVELAYWLSGLTRAGNSTLAQDGTLPAGVWKAVLLVGVADALSALVNFYSTMFLYRLFYATWFIASYVVISGLLYTALGVKLGFTLASGLKRVIEV